MPRGQLRAGRSRQLGDVSTGTASRIASSRRPVCSDASCQPLKPGGGRARFELVAAGLWPVSFLVWEMPYHAEHHRHPALPFFALAAAHSHLGAHLQHVARRGYLGMHIDFVLDALRTLRTSEHDTEVFGAPFIEAFTKLKERITAWERRVTLGC